MNNTPQASPSLLSEEITPDLVREWLLQKPVGLDKHLPERCQYESFLIHALATILSDPQAFLGVQQCILRLKIQREEVDAALAAPAFVPAPRAFQCGVAECPAFNGDQQRA